MSSTKSSPNNNSFTLILAGIFVFLFIVSTVAVIFSYFPTRQILNPDFYKQTLADEQVYQNLPMVIAGQLAATITQDGNESSLGSDHSPNLLTLSQEEWESILIELLDPNWLQTQTENIIDQFFDILLVSPDPVNTPILLSLNEVKSRLTGPEGARAFELILEAQPPCSVNQLLGLLQLGLGLPTTLDTIICRPPEYIISELSSAVNWFLSSVVDQVPDQVSISLPETLFDASAVEGSPDPNQASIPEIIQNVRMVNTTILWTPLIPLIFLILITIFAVRSLNDFLLWWGGSLFAAGLVSLLLSLSSFPVTNWALSRFIPFESGTNFALSNIMIQLGVADLSREFASRLAMSVVIPSIVITTIGFALLLASYLLARSSPQAEAAQINSPHPSPDEIER